MPLPDGEIYLLPRFLADTDANPLFDTLSTELAWTRHRVRLFGREHLTPRLCAWYGDPGARYAYSGQALEPLPWPPALAGLRARLHTALGLAFNSTLVALILSMVLMLMLHMLQQRQEALVLELQTYCRAKLIDIMKVPASEPAQA